MHRFDKRVVPQIAEDARPIFGIASRHVPRADFDDPIATMVEALHNYPIHSQQPTT